MDQAQDLDHTVGRQAVDDEMTRLANATCRLSEVATKPEGVGMNISDTGHLNRPDPTRPLAERSHDRQNQLAIPSGGLQPVVARAAEEKGVDLIFGRPGKPVGQLLAVREPSP